MIVIAIINNHCVLRVVSKVTEPYMSICCWRYANFSDHPRSDVDRDVDILVDGLVAIGVNVASLMRQLKVLQLLSDNGTQANG